MSVQVESKSDGIVKLPEWAEDESAQVCTDCQEGFWLFKRRHHCRRCGGVFCHYCTLNSIDLNKYGLSGTARVCNKCYVIETVHIPVLEEGETFVVYPKDEGGKYFVCISDDLRTISWERENESGAMKISDISAVWSGKIGSEFKKATGVADHLCFSVVFGERTLGLQAQSLEVRDKWVEALKALSTFPGGWSPDDPEGSSSNFPSKLARQYKPDITGPRNMSAHQLQAERRAFLQNQRQRDAALRPKLKKGRDKKNKGRK